MCQQKAIEYEWTISNIVINVNILFPVPTQAKPKWDNSFSVTQTLDISSLEIVSENKLVVALVQKNTFKWLRNYRIRNARNQFRSINYEGAYFRVLKKLLVI